MLPGFRFLLAAILLSTSILVFGLGAAALLRATHEQYVSNPSWRNGPQEQVFAQAPEPAQPVLAALRAEPEVPVEPVASQPEPSIRDLIPTIGLPVSEHEQVAAATTEAEVQPELAAPPADAEAVELAETETTTEVQAPAPADTLTSVDTTASIPEDKPATVASEPAPADPSLTQASSALDIAAAKVAALDDPATTASKNTPAKPKADLAKPETKAAKPRAQRAKKHRRIVRRPPPQQLQQSFDPFGQPQTLATTAARARH
jgi:hypothetical protein